MGKFSIFSDEQLLDAIENAFGNLRKASELLGMKYSKSDARSLSVELDRRNIDKPTKYDKRLLLEKEYLKHPCLCKYCKTVLDYEHRNNMFCSQKCAVLYLNTNRKISDIKYCINCNKELSTRQSKYCSLKCQKEYEQKEYITEWKNGRQSGLSGEYGISNRIRKYLMLKYNNKCELCGWGKENVYTHTIPLEIHHKDGNYLNNTEDNLLLLCPNCHALTETFKSHNKDGRKGRSKYY